MTWQLEVPATLATQLGLPKAGISRAVLEGFAAEAFRDGRLSAFQVRTLLHQNSRGETRAFLSAHGAWPALTTDDILSDAATAAGMAPVD